MNPSFEPRFDTLVEIYTASVAQFADRPLFGTKYAGEWVWLTYGEFAQSVDALRGALADLGIAKDDRVAVISNNRPEWAISAYATYGLGGQLVPMYEAQLADEWEYILENCGARFVFVANHLIGRQIHAMRDRLPVLEHIIVYDGEAEEGMLSLQDLYTRGEAHPAPMIEVSPDDIAGFIYTSGTTGDPKGVLLRHRNFAHNVSAAEQINPIRPDDRSLSFLPWAHSFGQTVELHVLFSRGASIGIAESVPQIIDNLAEVQPTLLISVPRIFNRIYDRLHKRMEEDGGLRKRLFDAALANAQRRRELADQGRTSAWVNLKHALFDRMVFSRVRERFGGRLRFAFSGGAAISKQVAEFVDDLGIMVFEGYGLTETSPIATANWPGTRKIGSIGKAIPGIRIEIDTDVTGDPKNGEIIVHGHNVMKGYFGLPEQNALVFTEDGGFRTGDMGHVDDEGFVFITGRIKEQYKLENGKYVVPSPLEEQLKLAPSIANVLVFGHNKPFNTALIVPDFESLPPGDPEALCADDEVRDQIAAQLAQYSADFKSFERPREFVLVPEDFTTENGMLTPSLKLKRRVVIERYGDLIEGLYA